MNSRNNSPVASEAQKFFNVSEWRESFIQVVLRIGCVLGIGLIIVSFPQATTADKILFISLYIGLLTITLLSVPYEVRAYSVIVITLMIGINSILAWGPWIDGSMFFLTSIVLSGLLFDKRVDIITLISSAVFLLVMAILHSTGSIQIRAEAAPQTSLWDWAGYTLDFLVMGVVLVAAISQFKKAFTRIIQETQDAFNIVAVEREKLEEKVIERTEALENRMLQLRNSTHTARSIAEIQNISELIETTVDLLTQRFGYYHVGLFILDDQKRTAFLQASSSTHGKELIGQAFGVDPDRRNILATAVEQNRTLIASDIDQKNFDSDKNFPDTRSRMVLPLSVRGSVIGLLDLHSYRPGAFSVEDSDILRTLADLIAISFDNTRLLTETQSLITQLESNTSLQTARTWNKLTSRQRPGYQYTPAGIRPIFSRDDVENAPDNSLALRVPLILHGQHIGAIKMKRQNNAAQWSDKEKIIVEKIADQVALALENSRLVEEAQKSAARDQMIANISTRIRETLEIETVIRTAATELRRVFDLKEAEVLVGVSKTELDRE